MAKKISNDSVFLNECFLLDVNFDFTQSLYLAHILTCIINAISCLTAISGNAIVIFAVWRSPSLHSPSNIFLCCLALSDFAVGLVAQPCFVAHKIGELFHSFGMYCITRALTESLGYVTSGTSALTMTGIAVERYLALHLHLRYKEIVTIRRIIVAVAFFWVFFIALVASRLWIADDNAFNNITISVVFLNFTLTFIAYMKVLKCVKHHERRISHHNISQADLFSRNYRLGNILRYKKSTFTMIFIVGIFVACYIPFLCVKAVYKVEGYTSTVKTAYLYSSTAIFLNSSFNPVVYCWRITDIRTAVKETLSSFLCIKRNPNTVSTGHALPPRRSRLSFVNLTRASVSFAPAALKTFDETCQLKTFNRQTPFPSKSASE